MDSLGERVRLMRMKKRLSMEKLATELILPVKDKETGEIVSSKKTTSATISNIENDKHSPSLEMAVALADYFDVSLDWLVRGKDYDKRDISNQSDTGLEGEEKHFEFKLKYIEDYNHLQSLVREEFLNYVNSEEFTQLSHDLFKTKFDTDKKEDS
ncbi:transcriptional regulator with XRE-family HTH domain [Paenibacillus jamilae]|nr:transcriptional regulator with XRE-family HTH domain [Paenibacillus jamilae]